MKLDKDEKIMIVVDFYLLLSIIASVIIYFVFQNVIEVWTSVAFGLVVGVVGIFYSVRIVKAVAKRRSDK